MKKLLFLIIASTICMFFPAFAEKTLVECNTNKVFGDNTCHVCFEDSLESETNVVEITDIKIPWKNEKTDITEVIYKSENVVPEVITKLISTTTPALAKDVWKFTNPWKDDKEFSLMSGEVTFIETNKDAKIIITDDKTQTDKSVLVRAPLVYHEWTIFTPLTETDKEQTRNNCVLYATKFGDAPVLDTGLDELEDIVDDELNSAEEDGPDELDDNLGDDEDIPVMDSAGPPPATSIQAGPAEIILFLGALSVLFTLGLLRRREDSR